MSYADRWRRVWSIALAVGIGMGALVWSPLVTLGLVAFVWASAAVGLLLLESREGAPPHQPGTARRALALACGVVAALAAMTASPPVGLLLCSLAALTSPVAVRLVWRRTTAAADGPTTSPAEHPAHRSGVLDRPVTTVAALTDAELCRLWRGTFWELQARRAPDQVLRMVALRQSCLDELERRHPSALHAWLVSGARASGGPEKFLTDGERPGSADAA